jgi:flagellar export protein FliJ
MKAFSFPLESIRLLRQQRERAAQQRYARALAVCENTERKFNAANEELAAGYKLLGLESGQSSTICRLTQVRTWCAVLEMRFHECEAAFTEAKRSASEAFNFLCAATRDRETLDRFHEKSRRAWQRICQQTEQKMLDELAVQRQGSPALEHNFLN